MPRNEEYDWIFDYVLQFLESDKFDAAVMDFVDEKCFVFDDAEENKLIYTEIHREFCDHVEALLASNLGEVGITNEQFLESCETARTGRDVNATVFERLIAMDDFNTFKKIMTKRNTELQLEAMKSFAVNTPFPSKSGKRHFNADEGKGGEPDGTGAGDTSLMDPDELLALKEAEIMELQRYENMHEEEMQELLFQSLMEMELIHRQEELEHAELERALLLSLIAEEERLQAMMIDAKTGPDDVTATADRKESNDEVADSKASEKPSAKDTAPVTSEAKRTPKKLPTSSSTPSSLPDSFADIKPLKLKSDLKPLPSIKATSSQATSELVQDLLEKKKVTEQTIKKGLEQLQGQRKNEEELKQKLLEPAEIERRERHMKEQRDLLIAKKKAERERKVQAEEERKRKLAAGETVDSDEKGSGSPKRFTSLADDSKGSAGVYPSNDDIAEMRRATMRMALARRLKMDLLESEEAKRNEVQESQFAELDKKLQQVEQLREDNRKREYILSKQIERQQDQIARNIEISAVMMSRQRDD
eukprot:gene10372-11287_t